MTVNKNTLNLEKYACPINIRLIPYGGGWIDVYMNFGDGIEHYFVISNTELPNFPGFAALIDVLCRLLPDYYDYFQWAEGCEFDEKTAFYGEGELSDTIIDICDHSKGPKNSKTCRDVPWKASFTWDNEQYLTYWNFERKPNLDTEFNVHLTIKDDNYVGPRKNLTYDISYRDLCYATAKAQTEALKKFGFFGYNCSIYSEDLNVRKLLFIKAAALNRLDLIETTPFTVKAEGQKSNFQNEIELLLFEM